MKIWYLIALLVAIFLMGTASGSPWDIYTEHELNENDLFDVRIEVDYDRSALEGAEVDIDNKTMGTTNSSGILWINDVHEGIHHLRVSAELENRTVVSAELRLKLTLPNPNGTHNFTLSGVVLEGETPVQGVLLELYPSFYHYYWTDYRHISTETNSNGEFEIQVDDESYNLVISKSGYYSRYLTIALSGDVETTFQLYPDENETRMFGTVENAEGEPIDDALVMLYSNYWYPLIYHKGILEVNYTFSYSPNAISAAYAFDYTDETGYYEFSARPGRYKVCVFHGSYEAFAEMVTLDEGDNQVDLAFGIRNVTVKGYVVDNRTYDHVEDAEVFLHPNSTATYLYENKTDVYGRFEFEIGSDYHSTEMTLVVMKEGYRTYEERISINWYTYVYVYLEPLNTTNNTVTVQGTILEGLDMTPVAGADVVLELNPYIDRYQPTPKSNLTYWTVSDRKGGFWLEIENWTIGYYAVLYVWADGYKDYQTELLLSSDNEVRVLLGRNVPSNDTDLRVEGFVYDYIDKDPIAGADVILTHNIRTYVGYGGNERPFTSSNDTKWKITDETGYFLFRINNSLWGSYATITVLKEGFHEGEVVVWLDNEVEIVVLLRQEDKGNSGDPEGSEVWIDFDYRGSNWLFPEYIYVHIILFDDRTIIYEYEYTYIDENADGIPEYEEENESGERPCWNWYPDIWDIGNCTNDDPWKHPDGPPGEDGEDPTGAPGEGDKTSSGNGGNGDVSFDESQIGEKGVSGELVRDFAALGILIGAIIVSVLFLVRRFEEY